MCFWWLWKGEGEKNGKMLKKFLTPCNGGRQPKRDDADYDDEREEVADDGRVNIVRWPCVFVPDLRQNKKCKLLNYTANVTHFIF